MSLGDTGANQVDACITATLTDVLDDAIDDLTLQRPADPLKRVPGGREGEKVLRLPEFEFWSAVVKVNQQLSGSQSLAYLYGPFIERQS